MVLKFRKQLIILFSVALFLSANLFALEVPTLKGRVNDYANIINSSTENELNSYLESLENTTGIQMVVLTIPSLKGEDISSFSVKTAEKWKIGQNGKDNGALLIVAYNDREVRIEVGYGLENKLTDTKCGLIIRNVIIPEFKNGNYSAGILKGIKNMVGVATDNAELVNKTVSNNVDEDSDAFGYLVIILFILIFIISISSRSRRYYRRHYFPIFMPWFGPGPTHSNHSHSNFGGFGGFSGGSGFHGGGGHFGGGGASGKW